MCPRVDTLCHFDMKPSQLAGSTSNVEGTPLLHRLLTLREAAEVLQCSPRTLYRRIENDEIAYRRFGKGNYRFDLDDLMASCKRHSTRAEILA